MNNKNQKRWHDSIRIYRTTVYDSEVNKLIKTSYHPELGDAINYVNFTYFPKNNKEQSYYNSKKFLIHLYELEVFPIRSRKSLVKILTNPHFASRKLITVWRDGIYSKDNVKIGDKFQHKHSGEVWKVLQVKTNGIKAVSQSMPNLKNWIDFEVLKGYYDKI